MDGNQELKCSRQNQFYPFIKIILVLSYATSFQKMFTKNCIKWWLLVINYDKEELK